MNNQSQAGLSCYVKGLERGIVIDADNAFWAIPSRNPDGTATIQRRVLSLYEDVRNGLDRQMRDFRFSANLTAIYIDPTDRCNSACPYCYIPQDIRKNGRSMTRKELFYILKQASAYFRQQKRKAVIVFHAAEPLLVKDTVFEAIEKFDGEFKFGLQTNALLLERQGAEFLKRFGVGVGISLDHYLPDLNDRLRPHRAKDGNFRAAIRAMEWFDGYSGLNVITTVTRLNVLALSRMVEFLHARGVSCVLLNPVRLTQEYSRRLKPDERQMAENFIAAVDKAIELSEKSGRRIIVGNFTNIILGIVAPAARRLMCDISPCGGGRCFLTITAKGEMIPCGEFIGLKGFSGGNIFKSGIGSAMQSRPFKRIRARFVEKIDECGECLLRNICGAPCPAELHSLGGMYRKSVFCEFYKLVINHAFKLIAEGREQFCFREDGLKSLEYEYRL